MRETRGPQPGSSLQPQCRGKRFRYTTDGPKKSEGLLFGHYAPEKLQYKQTLLSLSALYYLGTQSFSIDINDETYKKRIDT